MQQINDHALHEQVNTVFFALDECHSKLMRLDACNQIHFRVSAPHRTQPIVKPRRHVPQCTQVISSFHLKPMRLDARNQFHFRVSAPHRTKPIVIQDDTCFNALNQNHHFIRNQCASTHAIKFISESVPFNTKNQSSLETINASTNSKKSSLPKRA